MEELIVLCSKCESQCEDIRDRIYGLVSLSNDLQIVPDYSKTRVEIYLDVILGHCSGSNSSLQSASDILTSAGCSDESCSLFATTSKLLEHPLWDHQRKQYCLDYYLQPPLPQCYGAKSVGLVLHPCSRIKEVGPILSVESQFKQYAVTWFPWGNERLVNPAHRFFQQQEVFYYHFVSPIGKTYSADGSGCFTATPTGRN